jgi:hypothetical protein
VDAGLAVKVFTRGTERRLGDDTEVPLDKKSDGTTWLRSRDTGITVELRSSLA